MTYHEWLSALRLISVIALGLLAVTVVIAVAEWFDRQK